MRNATFACPDLTTFCRVDELGLVVVGQRLEPKVSGGQEAPQAQPRTESPSR